MKLHDDHEITEKHTLNEISDMYPTLSMKHVRRLKKIQDKSLRPSYTVLDILELPCDEKCKVELYKMFAMLDMTIEYTDEYYDLETRIHQKIKEIQKGRSGNPYKKRVMDLDCDEPVRERLREHLRSMKMVEDREELSKMRMWLEAALAMPYKVSIPLQISDANAKEFVLRAQSILDQHVYGLTEVKEAIMRFVCIKAMSQDRHLSLSLCGPPGVGKTVISRAVAKILDLPFYQISLGGITHAEFLKGFESTYIGSKSGEMVRALQQMKCKNGVLFFDEYDKIEDNKEISNALLHITDPEQNTEFKDSYLHGIPIDLSHLWFIFSMNQVPQNKPLADRLNIVHIKEYTAQEKRQICHHFLIPRICESVKMPVSVSMEEDAVEHIVQSSDGSSIRVLRNVLSEVLGKVFVAMKTDNLFGLDLPPLDQPVVLSKEHTIKLMTKKEENAPPVHMYM